MSTLLAHNGGAGADHLKTLLSVARSLRTESVVDAPHHTDEPTRPHAILTESLTSTYAA
ncbi:MAG: hypothetical protein MO846_07000 [Candidatus Devosia symbiotica]|nr:hypothetical protein [Candidatus Devosia symbiotica]